MSDWISNLPSDAALLNALQVAVAKSKAKAVSITCKCFPNSYVEYRVANGSGEVSLRIALRTYLQRQKLLPKDAFVLAQSANAEQPQPAPAAAEERQSQNKKRRAEGKS